MRIKLSKLLSSPTALSTKARFCFGFCFPMNSYSTRSLKGEAHIYPSISGFIYYFLTYLS